MIREAPETADWIRANAPQVLSKMTPGDGRALGLAFTALHRNPLPGIYAREIPLEAVSGKFIEENLPLIALLLQHTGSPAWRPAESLHDQVGLRQVPRLVRVMILDGKRNDYGIPIDRFRRPADVLNVLVVENLRSFVTLPDLPSTLAIFGEGRATCKPSPS